MPVIDQLGLSVSVLVGGAPLAEYEDPEPGIDERAKDGFTHVSCRYIESKANAEFTITCAVRDWEKKVYQTHVPNFNLVATLYIDGKRISGQYYKPRTGQLEFIGTDEVDPIDHSAWQRAFKFSSVTTVDNADKSTIKEDVERTKDLGLIKLVLRRVIVQPSEAQPQLPRHSSDAANTHLSIAEKALKGRAISHGTSYSPAVPCVRRMTYPCRDIDSHPIAIFNIKYRSRDSLHAEMVIPRSPSRSPSPALDNLSPEELQRLARERLDQIKAEKNPVIKREFGETFDLTEENGPQRPLKISKVDGKETIDLTDD